MDFLFIAAFLSILIPLIGGFVYIRNNARENRKAIWLSNENQFIDPTRNSSERIQFPSLHDSPSLYLSVIVPSYNEEERLPIMLNETIEYLKQRSKADSKFTWEIIIVDDGSKDTTTKVALSYCSQESVNTFRVLTLKKNRGKGGAVKRGMLCARGKYLLMVDADGATKFSDLSRLEEKLKSIEKNGIGLAVGSRAHLQQQAVAKRSVLRNILMYGFHFLVSFLCVQGIQDTQCGFKLFTRKSAQLLFPNLHIERWAFDVELVFLGQRLGIPMTEVAVNWTEIPGSKLTPFAASVQMGKDLLRIRGNYMFRIWTIDTKTQ